MATPFRNPTVSVVIPTTGRPSLRLALRSAMRQDGCTIDPIVVFDAESVPVGYEMSGVRTLATGGRKGAAAARNLGVDSAGGDFIAFLDDDDEWLPEKLRSQLARADELLGRGAQPVVGSRVFQRRAAAEFLTGALPRILIGEREAPQDYLFRGRVVTASRPLFPTSTILTTAELARRVPWKTSLRRHQDWQWLIEAARFPDVEIVQVEQATAIYTVGSPKSISATPDWRSSLSWAKSWRNEWDGQAYADFLAAQVLRYALQSCAAAGVRDVVKEIVVGGITPSAGSIASGLLGLVPRDLAERVAFRVGDQAARRRKAHH